MDPINLIVAVNLFASISANFSGAKRALKASVSSVVSKPKTYLQKTPPNIAALVLVLIILGVFKIGTIDLEYDYQYLIVRISGMVLFIIFSWLQVKSFKSLGKSYAQEIVIFKDHQLATSGMYRYIRHPQYVCQFLSDLGAAVALLSYIALPFVIILELPLLILRAREEERVLAKHFGEEFENYKKNSGFIFPFFRK